MRRNSFFVVVTALLTPGCFSVLGDAQVGGVTSTRFEEGRYGVAAQVGAGLSIDEDRSAEHAGGGMSVRTKFTPDVTQVAVSPHVYYLHSSWVTPYARAGVNLLQFEEVDNEAVFGMFSPYAEAGMVFTPLVVSAFAEYDVRFSGVPNEPFVGLMLGVGAGFSSQSVREFGNDVVSAR
jgi:hypothetical protein